MSETEKKIKSVDEILKLIEEILDYNKGTQIFFSSIVSKVDKGESKPKQGSIAERVKLRIV